MTMWPILATLCICAANADGTHEDAPMMLQVNAVADFGKRPSKTPNIFFSDSTLKIKTLDDWHSDRDLAFVPPPIPLYFTKGLNISIVSAVPVYEQLSNGSHASYIAVVTDHPGAQSDISQHRWNWTQGQWEYLENQSLEKQSLETIREEEAGHYFTISSEETNKNHPSAENVKEHVSYVSSYLFCAPSKAGTGRQAVTVHGRVLHCPWSVDLIHKAKNTVHLFTADGKYLGKTVASQKPDALKEYNTMACVRDVFDNQNPDKVQYGRFSGPFKQLVEWMEYSNLHGIAHFLIYTFRAQDVGSKAILEPYIKSKIASRVHFEHYPEDQDGRFGYVLNDCLYRSKGHSKWLLSSIDIDEYIRVASGNFFPGGKMPVTYFDSGPDAFLKYKKMEKPQVHSIVMKRLRFARSPPNELDIASTWREEKPSEVKGFGALPKRIVNVDAALQLSIHYVEVFKGKAEELEMELSQAVIHHYRTPFREDVIYTENASTKDNMTTVQDTALQGEVALVRDAIQERFQVNDVSEFLKELAGRHPFETKHKS